MCNQPIIPRSNRFSRLLLCCMLCSFSPQAPAQIEQFNVAQCAQLKAALEHNREQQRRGYKLRQELKIKAQQTQLELQLHYHCQQPSDLQKPSRRRAPAVKASRPPATPAKPTGRQGESSAKLTISLISVKAPYQGAKQQAWLAYYQPPFYCFGVRHTDRIRQCVEQRQQAQQRFELQYHDKVRPERNNLSDQ